MRDKKPTGASEHDARNIDEAAIDITVLVLSATSASRSVLTALVLQSTSNLCRVWKESDVTGPSQFSRNQSREVGAIEHACVQFFSCVVSCRVEGKRRDNLACPIFVSM